MTDEVGYKRPPKATQFQPGKSGNPGGRPKKTPSLAAELAAELAEATIVQEGGRDLTVTKQRAFVKAVVRAAVAGDPGAAKLLVTLRGTNSDDPSDSTTDDEEFYEEHVSTKEKTKE
jgi:hypothetical protein